MRLMILIVIAVAVVLNYSYIQEQFQESMNSLSLQESSLQSKNIEESIKTSTYILTTKSLIFDIKNLKSTVKLIANANFEATQNNFEEEWRYSFVYQVLNQNLEVILERENHLIAKVPPPSNHKQQTSDKFYLESLIPGYSKTLYISLDKFYQEACYLQVQLRKKPLEVSEVVVRAYYQEKTSENKLDYLWQRIPDHKQNSLTQYNIYPKNLLSPQEKKNLLSHLWLPIAPQGIPGKDYAKRNLYVLSETQGEKITKEFLPDDGLLIDSKLHGVIAIPANGALVELHLENIQKNFKAEHIELLWYGKTLEERLYKKIFRDRPYFIHKNFYRGGLLEVKVNEEALLKTFIGKKKTQVDKKSQYLKSFLVSPDTPIEFQIFHENQAATFLRLDIRRFSENIELEQEKQSEIAYEFFQGVKILKKGNLQVENMWSLYDRIIDPIKKIYTTEPSQYYFSIPAKVTKIRFSSSQDTLINVYNRPSTLIYKTNLPEDLYDYSRKKKEQFSWFLIRPTNYIELVQKEKTKLVLRQSRPPQDDPEILQGRYLTESYPPQKDWRGRYLLIPRLENSIKRRQMLPVSFKEIFVNRKTSIELQSSYTKKPQISPKLIYIGKKLGLFKIEIYLDNKQFWKSEVYGIRGDIALPSLTPGPYTLRVVSSQDVRFFMSHIKTNQHQFVKRFANIIKPDEVLKFFYKKETPETENLSLRIFSPESSGTLILWVTIKASPRSDLQPAQKWTFRKRVFKILPSDDSSTLVLSNAQQNVNKGQLVIIPIHSDFLPGEYEINIKLKGKKEQYFTLSKILPGEEQHREFFTESK